MHLKDAHRMANIVDLDQTAPLGLHCLELSVLTLDHFGVYSKILSRWVLDNKGVLDKVWNWQSHILKVERWIEWGFFHDHNFTLKYHVHNSSVLCFDMQPYWNFYQLMYERKMGFKLDFELKGTEPIFIIKL